MIKYSYARRSAVIGNDAARESLPELHVKEVMDGMRCLEFMEKLLHHAAVAGAWATVFEMIVRALRYCLSR